jgi:hypothetical protein
VSVTCSGKSFERDPAWWMRAGDRHDGLVVLDNAGKPSMACHTPRNDLPDEEAWPGELEALRRVAARAEKYLTRGDAKSAKRLRQALGRIQRGDPV